MIGFRKYDVEALALIANPDVAESKEINILSIFTNPALSTYYSRMPVHVISFTTRVALGLLINPLPSLAP